MLQVIYSKFWRLCIIRTKNLLQRRIAFGLDQAVDTIEDALLCSCRRRPNKHDVIATTSELCSAPRDQLFSVDSWCNMASVSAESNASRPDLCTLA